MGLFGFRGGSPNQGGRAMETGMGNALLGSYPALARADEVIE